MVRTRAPFVFALWLLVVVLSISTSTVESKTFAGMAATSTPSPSNRNNQQLHQRPGHHVSELEESPSSAVLPHSVGSTLPRGGASEFTSALIARLKIGFYFALWYALNIIYNIVNKKVLNDVPAPLTVGTLQFGVGALYAATLWGLRLRPTPKLTQDGKKAVFNIGIHHSLGQLLSMVSLGAGPVSFTHIVKALEPFFSAMVSGIMFGKWMKPQVYATLIPVVGGVGYACLKERSFSWLAFWCAMGSNLAFALRAVVSKFAMSTHVGENITSANLFGLVTWVAFILSIPIALIMEGTSFLSLWSKALDAENGKTAVELARRVVVSGLFHYLNNEVMYLALSNVHPVTLAVGNTMKRVFIMVASVLVFRNPVSLQAGIGSAIGISGVLFYSLTKQYYEKLEATAVATPQTKRRKLSAKSSNV